MNAAQELSSSYVLRICRINKFILPKKNLDRLVARVLHLDAICVTVDGFVLRAICFLRNFFQRRMAAIERVLVGIAHAYRIVYASVASIILVLGNNFARRPTVGNGCVGINLSTF